MSITAPVLSAAATDLFKAGFGEANLEAFLAGDVADLAHAHLTLETDEQKAAGGTIPDTATVADVVALFEGIVSGESAHQAEELVSKELADQSSQLTPEQEAANKATIARAQAAAAPAPTPAVPQDAGKAGTETASTATSPAPVAPVVEPVADLAAEPAPVAPAETEQAVLETNVQPDWIESLTPNAKMLKLSFDEYMHKMRPRLPVTEVEIDRHQASLARVLIAVINGLSGDDFHKVFNYILTQFDQHSDGVFKTAAVHRNMASVQLDPTVLRLFQRLLNMFLLLANVSTREAAFRQVDLGKTLTGPITEAGRQRVFGFFGK